jgi:hypothetical protein
MKHHPDWRTFEMLVARIERVAAPHSAVVKSPSGNVGKRWFVRVLAQSASSFTDRSARTAIPP